MANCCEGLEGVGLRIRAVATGGALKGGRDARPHNIASGSRVEEAPGHGSDVVEELNGLSGGLSVDGTGTDEETKVSVDLVRRGVGDAVMV